MCVFPLYHTAFRQSMNYFKVDTSTVQMYERIVGQADDIYFIWGMYLGGTCRTRRGQMTDYLYGFSFRAAYFSMPCLQYRRNIELL